MRSLLALLALVTLLVVPGCKRPQPSPEYERATASFRALYAAQLDDAFLDPGMAEVEALLAQVPADSLDAAAARELQERITAGRAQAEARRAARHKAAADARALPDFEPTAEGAAMAAREAAEDAARRADAGLPGPAVGSSVADLERSYQGCLRRGPQVGVASLDGGLRQAWEFQDTEACRFSYPSLVGRIIVADDAKVLGYAAASSLRRAGSDGGS